MLNLALQFKYNIVQSEHFWIVEKEITQLYLFMFC